MLHQSVVNGREGMVREAVKALFGVYSNLRSAFGRKDEDGLSLLPTDARASVNDPDRRVQNDAENLPKVGPVLGTLSRPMRSWRYPLLSPT